MAIRRIDELVKIGTHPLEQHFDIPANSTEIVVTTRQTELENYEPYDTKDKEIEEDFQMIMDTALTMVDMVKTRIDEGAESRFLARLVEVAGQQMNIALSAADKKAKLKDNKDKFNHKKNTLPGNTTVNNTIIMDRNEMLAHLLKPTENDIIDIEHVEIENDKESYE